MVKNSRGFLSGNTRKLKRKKQPTINDMIKSFSIGDSVIISVQPERAGAPHLRYQGRRGIILEQRKKGYLVGVKAGKSTKKLVATAFHLKTASGGKR